MRFKLTGVVSRFVVFVGLLLIGSFDATAQTNVISNASVFVSTEQAASPGGNLLNGGTWKSGTTNLEETVTIKLRRPTRISRVSLGLKRQYAAFRISGTSVRGNFGRGGSSDVNEATFLPINFVPRLLNNPPLSEDPIILDISIKVTKQRPTDSVDITQLSIEGIEEFSPWQNRALPADSNNDGILSPTDVLIVINYLSRNGTSILPSNFPSGSMSVDVDGDLGVSPIDVLMVINALNRRAFTP